MAWLPDDIRRNLTSAAASLASLERRIAVEQESVAQEGMEAPLEIRQRRNLQLVQARKRLAKLQAQASEILRRPYE